MLFRSDKNFYEYDMVSGYPNACLNLEKLPRQEDWKVALNLDDFLKEKNIGGICKLNGFEFPEDIEYPCLPVYHDKKLVYPRSADETYVTLEEVKLAVEMGAEINFDHGFVYEDGTEDLTNYLKMLLDKKAEMTKEQDLVRRTLYKLMMNSIIGKFTQKVQKYDINDYKRWSEILDVPVYDLMSTQNIEATLAGKLVKSAFEDGEIDWEQAKKYSTNYKKFKEDFERPIRKKLNLGSGYYPEWNTLILGYARATLARAFWEHGAYVGTTDSFVTDHNPADGTYQKHNKKTGELMNIGYFDCNGIRFELERKGKRLVSVRTRLYALFSENGKVDHMAYHGISDYGKAKEFLSKPDWSVNERNYEDRHMIKIRESLRDKDKKLGQMVKRDKRVSWGWDHKRKLIGVTGKIKQVKNKINELINDEIFFMETLLKGDLGQVQYSYEDKEGFMQYRRTPSSYPKFFKDLNLSGDRGFKRFKKAVEKGKGQLFEKIKEKARSRLKKEREYNKPPSEKYIKLKNKLEKLKKNYEKNYQEYSKPFDFIKFG